MSGEKGDPLALKFGPITKSYEHKPECVLKDEA